jgi:hypothetical protein
MRPTVNATLPHFNQEMQGKIKAKYNYNGGGRHSFSSKETPSMQNICLTGELCQHLLGPVYKYQTSDASKAYPLKLKICMLLLV